MAKPQRQSYKPAFEVRWSRTPTNRQRNWAELYHTSPAFDALDMIAQDTANATLELHDARQYKADKEKSKPVVDHELLKLLDNPCPGHLEIDSYTLKYMTTVYMSTVGEFFWVKERGANGKPNALYPVLPQWVVQTACVTRPYFTIIPLGVTSAQEIIVPPEDIVWFRNPNLSDPFGRGRGRDESIGDEIETDEYSAKYQKNLMYNDAQPPLIISVPEADSATTAAFKESWIQKVGGWLNARKPIFLNTKVDVQKLTDSVREMDMVESRKYMRDVFNQHYSLPPEMRGILENSNRSTIDSADYMYKKNVLSRKVSRLLQILNRSLVPDFDSRLILVCDALVTEDEAAKRDWALKEFNAGLITLNEYHLKLGENPVANGDYYLRPSSVVMVLASEANIKPIAPPPPPPSKSIKSNDNEDPKETAWKAFDQSAESVEGEFVAAVGKVSREQNRQLMAAFNAAIEAGRTPEEALSDALEIVYTTKMDIQTFNTIAPAWVKAVQEGAQLGSQVLGGGVNWQLHNPILIEWAKEHGLSMAKEINGTTRAGLDALRPHITDALRRGDSIDKISDMLQHQYSLLDDSRATLIARTESMSSVNFGQFAVYKAEGVEEKEWLSQKDKQSRGAHKHDKTNHLIMDGQVVKIDEPFMVDGLPMMYPGDPAGEAKNNCNCRCSILPIIK